MDWQKRSRPPPNRSAQAMFNSPAEPLSADGALGDGVGPAEGDGVGVGVGPAEG